MIKIFLSLLLSINFLYANIKNADALYDVSYGIFGVLGKAKANISTDNNNNYIIKVKAYATGFSKVLSGNLVETYISKGKYINGKFQPTFFQKITSQNESIKTSQYTFDYKAKKINLIYTKKYKYYPGNETIDNILDLSYDKEYEWKTTTKNSTLDYWANEDILSLFFNIKHYISNINKTGIKHISAVGAGKKQKGKVDIIIPDTKTKKDMKKLLGQDKNLLIVKIYKDIFSSKSGELYLSLDDNAICNKSILKDVLFFGDVIGTLK